MAEDRPDESWTISIPTQGISITSASQAEVLKFLNEEIAYFGRLNFNGASVMLANQSYGGVNLSQRAQSELAEIIKEVRAGGREALDRYVTAANERLVLVGQSPTGKRVEQTKELSGSAALMLACIFSWNWVEVSHNAARDLILTLRAVAFANPANFGFDNLLVADQAAKNSREAWRATKSEQTALQKYIEEKTDLFDNLENLYRKQLTIQEPAVSWERIASHKARNWKVWLVIFAIMVITPIIAAIMYWESVSTAVSKITANGAGTFSIAGLAVVSIPALLYAWLLKNISRVFIQNLNLADDADHRRSLALTYMGLLQDDKRPTTDADRAIILNALFRPIPPQTNDEGPPAGVIDLIKK